MILESCWICNFFLIFLHSSPIFSSTSSSCTFVPPSVLFKCVLEKCLLACCKTCFDKYQLQVNDTLNEHRRFFLPFSLNEGDNAWNEEKLKLRIFFPSHMPHMVPLRSHKGLIQALCSHHTLLWAFMTNAAAISTSYWPVSLKIGYAQNFCASLSRDYSQSVAGRCSRRAGITSCLNLSANQQSNAVLFFQLIFLTHRNS